MKIQMITTYDRGKYCEALGKMYNDYDVKRVDTHTELAVEGNRNIIYYIAIVFFNDKETSQE